MLTKERNNVAQPMKLQETVKSGNVCFTEETMASYTLG